MKKQSYVFEGYETRTKTVSAAGTSGRVFLPKQWIDKEVVVILTEPIEK